VLLGVVEGVAISTIKHRSLKSWKLLIVQPVDLAGRPDGDPIIAVDRVGAGQGCWVVISNDGKGAREMVGDKTSPVRWTICGLVDHEGIADCQLNSKDGGALARVGDS
jgi:ethanolamine utilization protein EutN